MRHAFGNASESELLKTNAKQQFMGSLPSELDAVPVRIQLQGAGGHSWFERGLNGENRS